MKLIELLHRPQNETGRKEVKIKLRECLEQNGIHFWESGQVITISVTRILIGVADWSAYDLKMLDSLSEFFIQNPSKRDAVRIDIFDFDDIHSQADLDKYIPGVQIETLMHSPIVGIWYQGVLEVSQSGYHGRQAVMQAVENL